MTRTITRSYDNYETASSVVEQLEAAGISSRDVSIVGRNRDSGETNAVAGATAGGLVGSFVKEGHDEGEANFYAETVRRGGSVVSVRAEPEQEATVEAILGGANPIDSGVRTAEYRQEGWTRFDEKADPYLRGQVGI